MRTIPFSEGIFSLTITCAKWINLIEIVNGYDIIYNWFNLLKSKGHFICGYVIMPNHIHVIIGFKNVGQSINTIVGNGKRFIAYEIIKRLKENNQTNILNTLESLVEPDRKIKAKKHEVWQASFDWKYCDNESIIDMKINYFHNNPCVSKWNLATSPVFYRHSSAKFYIENEQGIYEVTSYFKVLGENLT